MNNQEKKQYKTNLPRYIVAGILAIAIVFMWINNKSKAEEQKQQPQEKTIKY